MAARLWAELIPTLSGSNKTAEFRDGPNSQALMRATEISILSNAAGNIEVDVDPEGTSWKDTGEDAIIGLYTMTKVPVCRAIRVAGVAAADPAPVRVFVRHGL